MDFLMSAVASISKGPAFPYNFAEKVDIEQSAWTLHNGTRREDGMKCSIFSFDAIANRSQLQLARNALRKFRTLRHPGVIKVLDTVETDQIIYIATERVIPLTWYTRRKALSEESLKWGVQNVAKTVKFINDEAASIHGSIRTSSIYASAAGEWKVGGLDLCSSIKEDEAVIFTQASILPDMGRYTPPEALKSGWESVRSGPLHAVDSYGFGVLIAEVFSGNLVGAEGIGTTRGVPASMQTTFKRLVHAVPKMRLSVGHFLEQGCRRGGFFDTPLIKLTDALDSLGLKSENERDSFLSDLENTISSADLPEDYLQARVLPELLKAVEFSSTGGASSTRSLSIAMRIASKLDSDTYTAQITPVIIRLFTLPDRALRVCLLDNLPHMIEHLNQKVVNEKIFPQIVTGFGDLAPVVREQTVKAVLVIVSKLSDRVINGELLRHLAKTANDEQPGIRTNTTICLGKIARNLGTSTRTKVLSAAFSRSLRDPFLHARNAALLALAATADIFSEEDCANKMLPVICPSLIDREKMIRVQAEKTMGIYLERIRKYAQTLPDTMLPPNGAAGTQSEASTRMGTPQPGTAGTGTQLLGWAISSFTNKISTASGDIQSNATAAPSRPSSTPPGSNGIPQRPAGVPHAPSAPLVPRISSNLRSSTTVSNASSTTAHEPEDETFNAAWGDMEDEPSMDAVDAWEETANEPAHQATTTAPATARAVKANAAKATPYDDGGEPDFEGWLSAQASSKSSLKGNKPLPKGLAKKPPPTSRQNSSVKVGVSVGKSDTNKGVTPVTKPAVKKQEAQIKKDDDDDWGDAWG